MKLKLCMTVIFMAFAFLSWAQYPEIKTDLDKKVKSFLEANAKSWRDLNVPLSDGKILFDIIVKNNYKTAVEIGTSTGHSAIWIAWALSKTGGKMITIEIDSVRYQQAKAHFEQAGLSDFIDARLGNAHELVPKLMGKYEFVFSDADKDWYKQYFIDMDPKIVTGGCFVAHNVDQQTRDMREFLDHIESQTNYKTTINGAVSISYKTEGK